MSLPVENYYHLKAVSEEDPNFLLKTLTLLPCKSYVPTFLRDQVQDDGSQCEWLGTYHSEEEPDASVVKEEEDVPNVQRAPEYSELSSQMLQEIPNDSLMEEEHALEMEEEEHPEQEPEIAS